MDDGAVKASGRFSGGRRPQRPKSQSLAPSMLSTNEFGTQAFVDDLLSSMEPVAESSGAPRAKRGASLDDSDDSDDGMREEESRLRANAESLRDELRSAATSCTAALAEVDERRRAAAAAAGKPAAAAPPATRPAPSRFGGKGASRRLPPRSYSLAPQASDAMAPSDGEGLDAGLDAVPEPLEPIGDESRDELRPAESTGDEPTRAEPGRDVLAPGLVASPPSAAPAPATPEAEQHHPEPSEQPAPPDLSPLTTPSSRPPSGVPLTSRELFPLGEGDEDDEDDVALAEFNDFLNTPHDPKPPPTTTPERGDAEFHEFLNTPDGAPLPATTPERAGAAAVAAAPASAPAPSARSRFAPPAADGAGGAGSPGRKGGRKTRKASCLPGLGIGLDQMNEAAEASKDDPTDDDLRTWYSSGSAPAQDDSEVRSPLALCSPSVPPVPHNPLIRCGPPWRRVCSPTASWPEPTGASRRSRACPRARPRRRA